ncbi:MAG: helix-turn-helix domain-containing protein [Fusobacteriaceae bacterium]
MVTITRLGNILKKLRNSRNLNMVSLASVAHIGIGTVGDIERGKNNSKESTLEKISLALNLTKEERLELYSGILPEDVGLKLTGKEKVTIDKFREDAQILFLDTSIADSEKEELILLLNTLYYTTKKK